ncbi:dihydroxyacetone kinase subunit DhaK [Synergistales bacterium]|nr:dihydroxyacetone kinase subunit DhaK [Synergistales bacterium]GHV50729.1 dihydroxyacetone kinase subunit DhaK [Synergistales bacterium]
MKKLINKVDDAVAESLAGMGAAYPDLIKIISEHRVVARAEGAAPKVAVISGGGSGHEPMHGGFVGFGMLDGACAGEVFTSPSADQMYEAGKAIDGGKGILFLVKNYTGDVMNFQMAADMLKGEGIEVEQVVVNDDVAVKDSLYTAGRRGVGGTVIIEKLIGAAAQAGTSLSEVKELAERVNANIRSMGIALTSCTVPAVGKPTFDLPDDEIELGVGIHGEPGRERVKHKTSAEIVEYMGSAIVGDLPFKSGDEVLAFVNGMGGTPLIELFVVYNDLAKFLGNKGIKIARNLVGNYITSLDMQGCSITLLKLDSRMKALWDYPVHTPALRWGR